MKKVFSIVLAVALVAVLAVPSFAAYTAVATDGNNVAVATVSAVQLAIDSVQWYNIDSDDDETYDVLSATQEGNFGTINPAVNPYANTSNYLNVQISGNQLGWNLSFYLNNAAPTADPQYTGPLTGDVNKGLVNTVHTEYAAPLKWGAYPHNAAYPFVEDLAGREQEWTPVDPDDVIWAWPLDASIDGAISTWDPGELWFSMVTGTTNAGAMDDQVPPQPLGVKNNGQNVDLYFLANFETAIEGSYKTSTITLDLWQDL